MSASSEKLISATSTPLSSIFGSGFLIIVPILVGLFSAQGFPAAMVMQLAVGTSLATIIFTSLSSMRSHHRRGAVLWPIMVQLSLGILLGAWLGGLFADWMGE